LKIVRFIDDKGLERIGNLDGRTIQPMSREPWFGGVPEGEAICTSEIERMIAPILPKKVVGVALNFPGVGVQADGNAEPLIFMKAFGRVSGPNDLIESPFDESFSVWGEPELAMVISKPLFKASMDECQSAIAGYTIANDVTTKNIGSRDHHLARSKCVESFCVLGPFIDTSFQPFSSKISGYQNDVLIRTSSLNERVMGDAELLQWLSGWMKIDAGDVILTGCPPRLGDRSFLAEGDIYRCEIDGLGYLENKFVRRT